MKLNQVIAIEKGAKSNAEKALTESHHRCQKVDLFTGLARTYRSLDAEGEELPDETQIVQTSATAEIAAIFGPLAELVDIVATKVATNASTGAAIKVGNDVVVENAPVELLLFLEKQLVNIHTYVSKMPTLHPGENWRWDDNRNCYVTEPRDALRTKKILRNHVKAEATKEHPAQVEVYTEDVQVGTWSTTKFSGAMPAKERTDMLRRVEALQAAVKMAREEANMAEAQRVKGTGERVLRYLFGAAGG